MIKFGRAISQEESEFLDTIGGFLPEVRDVEWLGMATTELEHKLNKCLNAAFNDAGDTTRADSVLCTNDYETLAALCRINNGFLVPPYITSCNGIEKWKCRMVVMTDVRDKIDITNLKEYVLLIVELRPPYLKKLRPMGTAESNFVKEQHYAKWVLHTRYRRALSFRLTSESKLKNSVIINKGVLNDEAQKKVVTAVVQIIKEEKCWKKKSGMLSLYFHYNLDQQLVSLLVSVSGFAGTTSSNESASNSIKVALVNLGYQASVTATVISYTNNEYSRINTFVPELSFYLSREPVNRNRLLWCRFLITMLQPNETPAHPRNRIMRYAQDIESCRMENFIEKAEAVIVDARECYNQFVAANKEALKKHKDDDAEVMVHFGLESDTFKCTNIIAFVETYFWFRKMKELGSIHPLGLEESKWAAEKFSIEDPERAYEVMSRVWEFLDRFRWNDRELGKFLSVCAESNLIDFSSRTKCSFSY